MDLKGWVSESRPFWTHRPRTAAAWKRLASSYGGSDQLRQVLAIAEQCGCRTIIVENRYVDVDYRSEFSAYWSLKFAGRPAFTRRMHFFADEIADEEIHALSPAADYIGYTILRPLPIGVVGRTIVRPPPQLLAQRPTLTLAVDKVSLFGTELAARGVPFYTQDGEYIRCAHASAWIAHYHAHTRRLAPRRSTAQIASYAPAELSDDRPLPSTGMNYHQLQAVFGRLELPALMYITEKLPPPPGPAPQPDETPRDDASAQAPASKADRRAERVRAATVIIRRYLNSGFPVMVATTTHTFMLVGYYQQQIDGHTITRFIACDDQVGPYEAIDDPIHSGRDRGTAEVLMIPLPPRIWLSGEAAESDAHHAIRTLKFMRAGDNTIDEWRELSERLSAGEISLQTMLKHGADYKSQLLRQDRHPNLVRALRLAHLSNWVWVVEAHDQTASRHGRPPVLAEIVYDATSSQLQPHRLAFSYPGGGVIHPPDKGHELHANGDLKPWKPQLPSACPANQNNAPRRCVPAVRVARRAAGRGARPAQ